MRFLAAIGALAIVVGIGCAAFFFGGYYSVAGTAEDPAAVTWALTRVRTASINRHANDNPPASFGDAAMVQAGAKAYASFGCANCHGAPGVKWLKFSEGLHPDPPDLKEVAGELSPAQLFWVIKNGINMTGMPSFAQAGARTTKSGRLRRSSRNCRAFPTPTTRPGPRRLNRSNRPF